MNANELREMTNEFIANTEVAKKARIENHVNSCIKDAAENVAKKGGSYYDISAISMQGSVCDYIAILEAKGFRTKGKETFLRFSW